MNWERAKTILIVMFSVTNIFLLIILLQTRLVSNRIGEDTIKQTATILQSGGIQVSFEQIPDRRQRCGNLTMRNYFDDPQQAAEKILGRKAESISTDEENYIYEYKAEKGSLIIQGQSFIFESALPMQGEEGYKRNEKECYDLVTEELKKMGFEKKSLSLENLVYREKNFSCRVVPLYEKIKVYGVSMAITADASGIRKIEGNWFVPVAEESGESDNLLDITTALLDLRYQETEPPIRDIQKIETAFYVSEAYLDSREITAVPIYVLRESTGMERYVDARNGGLVQ